MSDSVLPFPGKRARTERRKRKSTSLCREGHHRWVLNKQTNFDVKQGKLLTTERCDRCGIERTRAK